MDNRWAPKVSVIVPVYNVDKFLKACIESIQRQTLREIEIICVNDGSTDSSLEILQSMAKKDPRVVVVDQKNAGAGAARNNGVRLARGEYIGFVDSDDIIYPTMYEELYNKAVATKAEMVISGEIDTFFGENICFPIKNSTLIASNLELGTFTAIEYPELLQNVFLWNRLYSRKFWNENALQIPEHRRFAEDLCICTQASVLAKKIAYVKGPHYKYRNKRENSLSDSLAKSQKKLDYLIAFRETKEFLEKTGAYDFYAKDFLTFSVFLFILLQKRLTNYNFHKDFFCGMADMLDEDDFDILKTTWLWDAYPRIFSALRAKKSGWICFENNISVLFDKQH